MLFSSYSGEEPPIVSPQIYPYTQASDLERVGCPGSRGELPFVGHSEALFGPVQKDTQVVSVNPELPAHHILIFVLQKEGSKQSPIPFGELVQDVPDLL